MDKAAFHPVRAGAAYFAMVFALGFVLGTIRTLWLAPMAGATLAVLAEIPLILTASWFAACWLLRGAQANLFDRAAMGALAFALLMAAELVLAVLLFGQTLEDWRARIITMPGPIGLAGQILFGLMPLLVRSSRAH